jgi:hypothetical protein
VGKRLSLAIESGFCLFAVCAVACVSLLWFMHHVPSRSLVMAVTIPALAALCLVCAVAILPGLIPTHKIEVPQTFTLPILHSALMIVLVQLLLTTPAAMQRPPEQLRVLVFWQDSRILIGCTLVEFGLLSLLALAAARKAPR